MKKICVFLISIILLLSFSGCSGNGVKRTMYGNIEKYFELEDGTWICNKTVYKYRLEIRGRMNNASCDLLFVYLSNLPEISFEQAWKAAGLSSNSDDYFDKNDAVLVECNSIYEFDENDIKRTVNGNRKTYYEMNDGTWMCDSIIYRYKFEVRGEFGNPLRNVSVIYLSNLHELSFEQAILTSGLGSNAEDYFSKNDIVVVEWNDIYEIDEDDVKSTVYGKRKTYYEMNDGTWMCDNIVYQYRLEIRGQQSGVGGTYDLLFVYLSNLPEISFERAMLASGISSNPDDYFSINDAVFVDDICIDCSSSENIYTQKNF